jgi:hypothetical protein
MPCRYPRRWATGALALLGLIAPARAFAQSQIVSVTPFANFQTAGVLVTISGDTQGNAYCNLAYKRAADAAFKTAMSFPKIDATHLAGSVFGLSPGTAYNLRVTLVDPDGVAGTATQTVNVTTRADTFAEPTAQTLYVATSGSDSNPGTLAQPLRTIQRAETLANAGTLVLIQPGVYREEVTVNVSGNASQPIVFRGNGAGVIVDGADATIAAGVTWTAEGGGVYSRAIGFNTNLVVSELGRMYEYFSLADLQALPTGAPGGFFLSGGVLRVRFSNNTSPATHTMHVARLENGFHLTGVSFVRIENVEIRHYGSDGFGKGVYLEQSNDCAVRASNIHEVQLANIWLKGGNRNVIEDNTIRDTSIFNWPWDWVKGSSAENFGVYFTDNAGRGNVVRRNTLIGTFNGIFPCGRTVLPEITTETDVHHNTMSQHLDDAFELEYHCSNVRVFENRIRDVHMVFSVAPAGPGPLYFVRNVAYNFGNTRASQIDNFTSSSIKIHADFGPTIGPIFLLHNTIFTQAPNTSAMTLFDEGGAATSMTARNNVIAGTDYVLNKSHPVPINWNGDDLYTTSTSHFVRWHTGATYSNLAAFRTGTGQENPLGISAPPNLVNPAGGQYQPAANSPLVNAGEILPNINDDAIGPPDIGAIEIGFIPPPLTRYFTVPPCRLVDTRGAVGPRGGPQIFPNGLRVFPLTGVCAIPATAKALVLNATVVGASAPGHIRLFPGNEAPPLASLVQFVANRTRAGMAIVRTATDGAGTIGLLNGSSGNLHFVLDVNGYFE